MAKDLPMDIDLFDDLFDFLENYLNKVACSHDFTATTSFLWENGYEHEGVSEIIDWCKKHHGYCDCEVLMNTPEYIYDSH